MPSPRKRKVVFADKVTDDEDGCRSETGENDVPAPPFPVNKVTANRNRECRDYIPYRAQWFPRDEESFIKLIIEQVHARKMFLGGFKPKTWNYIMNQFNEVSGKNLSLNALKGKYYRFKKSWQEFKTLLDFSSEFVWDQKTNKISAPEDAWMQYLQVYPKNKQFKRRGCKYYLLLTEIFGGQRANGHVARSSAENQYLSNQEDRMELASGEVNGDQPNVVAADHVLSMNIANKHRNFKKHRNSGHPMKIASETETDGLESIGALMMLMIMLEDSL